MVPEKTTKNVPITEGMFTDEQKQVIKNLICSNLSDDEMTVFLHHCYRTRLDPIVNQIYAMKISGQMVIMASIDGLRLIAERTGRYAPGRQTVFTFDQNNQLESATVFVKKMTDDGTWHEVSATAFNKEYNKRNKMWNSLPSVMLEKCAESRALRRGFPDAIGQIYTRDEMRQAEADVESLPTEAKDLEENTPPNDDMQNLIDLLKKHPQIKERVDQQLKNNYQITKYRDIPADLLMRVTQYVNTLIDRQKESNNE